jgi:uncharacterized protein (TIGR03067 family)
MQDAARADIRADIYSLGCTLYYLLTGSPPFKGKSLFDLLQAHLSKEATPLNEVRGEIPAELAAVVAKMMAKEPQDRYQKPIEVTRALAPFVKASTKTEEAPGSAQVVAETLEHIAHEAARPAPARPAKKARRWWPAAGIAAALAAILIGLWATGVLRLRTPDGTLVIDVNEPGAEILVDGKEATVTWDQGRKRAEIRIKPGTGKVEVKVMKEGFGIVSKSVEIEDGGRTIFTATLQQSTPPVAPAAKKNTLATDLEKLQGNWLLVAFEGNGQKMSEDKVKEKGTRLTITGDNYRTVGRSVDGTEFITEATIKLDPTKKPKAIDGTITFVTSGNRKGQTHLGIYELEGDQLKLCLTGGKERPQDFTTRPGSGHALWIWKRVSPAAVSSAWRFMANQRCGFCSTSLPLNRIRVNFHGDRSEAESAGQEIAAAALAGRVIQHGDPGRWQFKGRKPESAPGEAIFGLWPEGSP